MSAARDDLRDAVCGLRAYTVRIRAALDAAAPPLARAERVERAGDASTEVLALLGALSVCARLDALFARLTPRRGADPVGAETLRGSLLR